MKNLCRYTFCSWFFSASILVGQAVAVGAQESSLLRGRVTDTTGAPLAGTLIEIAGTFWRSTTDPEGSFVLAVPRGSWLVRARRLGFSPETLSVSIPSAAVVIRLRAAPFELRSISVTASQAPPLSQTVTSETVRQVPPLGEPDIFRSVVLLPGVSQPNDLKGRIHLAGGASDETGVSLDGHPLQEPFHLLGVLGAFNIAALDRADVLIHHVPVDKKGGLSGLIDLSSRRIPAKSESELLVGLLSAGVTTVRPLPGGFDVLGSVRTTYLDNLIESLGGQVRVQGDELTLLGYRDGLLRIGKTLSERMRAEALFFSTADNRRTAGVSSSDSPPYTWGESLWGLRLDHRGANWMMTARGSFNRARADMKRGQPTQVVPNPEHVRLRRDWMSSSLDVTRVSQRTSLRVGAGLDVRRSKQEWEWRGSALLPSRAPRRFSGAESQALPSLFAEAAHRSRSNLSFTAGIRASYLDGRAFAAPSAVVGKAISRAMNLEFALERRYQFIAELEEPEEGTGNQPLFLLGAPRVADVAAVSLSSPSAVDGKSRQPTWNAVAFAKRYRDRTNLVGDPRRYMDSTGRLPDIFPDFARVPGRSYGAALSATHAVRSAALFQASYTFQRATERLDGVDSPVAWDAPHALSLFGSLQLRKKWTVNAVFQAKSGPVATPLETRVLVGMPTGILESRYLPGKRNSARLSSYQRLDAAVRRRWRGKGAEWALSLQVVNLLRRTNALTYNWSSYFCVQSGECESMSPARRGLPVIPSLMFEIRW